jgi:outer membrane protein assembly factor BamE (lipoprotein component of BamABCDE complex)
MAFRSRSAVLCSAVALAIACSNPPAPPPPQPEKPAALGAAQHEIKAGMDQSAVREALGAPKTVSSDSQHREVWTYDQIPSDRIDTSRSVGGGLVVLGGGRGALDGASAPAAKRTLTIILYFDEQKKVREIAYNYSSF